MTAIIDGTNGVTTPNVLTSSSGVALTLQSGGTTAVTIDTSQNVGVGTTSPAFTSSNRHVLVTDGTTDSIVGVMAGGVAQAYLQGTSSATNLFTANSNPLVLGTANLERMRINGGAPILCLAGGNTSATGTGIAFPATQNASSDANTLDDYEEGTFTPTVFGNSSAGSTTYTNQSGTYTKIGRVVYFMIDVGWSAQTGSGSLNIGGLPFVCGSVNGQCNYSGNTLPLTALNYSSLAQVNVSTTYITLYQNPTGSGALAPVITSNTSGRVWMSGFYII